MVRIDDTGRGQASSRGTKETVVLIQAALKRSLRDRHDPIGINFEDNTDEYDPEAGTILPRLRRDLSVEKTTGIVHEEFVRWFERKTAGSRERYSPIAAEIMTAYQQWE